MAGALHIGKSEQTSVQQSDTTARAVGQLVRVNGRSIAQPEMRHIGTVALVAPNIVLTAGHNIDVSAPVSNLGVRFGYYVRTNENGLSVDRVLGVVEHREDSDYAILRLEQRRRARRPFEVGPRPPTIGEPIRVLHHAGGEGMKVSPGKILGLQPDGLLRHDADTLWGASGAPILDADQRLLGIHVGGYRDDSGRPLHGTYNLGVPSQRILDISRFQWSGR